MSPEAVRLADAGDQREEDDVVIYRLAHFERAILIGADSIQHGLSQGVGGERLANKQSAILDAARPLVVASRASWVSLEHRPGH